MKVAPKLVFLFKDPDGFGTVIADSLHPASNYSSRILEESFQLPLDHYGIASHKACGTLFHYLDESGSYQVSVLLLEMYEPPLLVCALNEVLTQITGESGQPTLVVPFVVPSSKLKGENKTLATNGGEVSLCAVQIGKETDLTRAIAARTAKAPPSLRIYHEPLACFLQLARVLNFPASVIIGYGGQSLSDKTFEKELEIIYEIGELLGNTTSLCFSREKIKWNPVKTSRESKEPWRALYG